MQSTNTGIFMPTALSSPNKSGLNSVSKLTRTKTYFTRALVALGLLTTSLFAASGAQAQQASAWVPNKTIRVIVPYSPGGGTDVLARLIFAQVGNALGQPFVVENKAGNNGLIGANYAYDAPPDGYVLLFGAADNVSVAPHIYKKTTKFDQNNFTAVAPVAKMGFVLASKGGNEAKTLDDIIAKAKAAPADKPYSYGHWGAGSMAQMGMELIKAQAQVTSGMQEVPYAGAAPVLNAILGGHVVYGFIANPQAIANKDMLVLYGIGSDDRFSTLPNVPTLKELGFKVNNDTWFGVLAPPKTPENIVKAIGDQINLATKDPKILARMTEMGYTPFKDDPSNFGAFVKAENARWGEVVKAANIRVDE